MRIDRLLCNLRFVRTRGLATELVRASHLRRNGVRILRPSQAIACGDILTIALGERVRLVEVLALPERRGSASAAQACYRMFDEPRGSGTQAGARAGA